MKANIMQYKGYIGSVVFDEDDEIFHGKLEYIKALVTYEAKNAKGLKKAFHDAVDSYLKMCERHEEEPEKPFKGSFNVRTGPELHRHLAMLAAQRGVSLNRFIIDSLDKVVNQ